VPGASGSNRSRSAPTASAPASHTCCESFGAHPAAAMKATTTMKRVISRTQLGPDAEAHQVFDVAATLLHLADARPEPEALLDRVERRRIAETFVANALGLHPAHGFVAAMASVAQRPQLAMEVHGQRWIVVAGR